MLLSIAWGCGRSGDAREQIHDILLVTVDTARADRYSYTGSTLVRTEVADSLATSGRGFLAAFAPSPITLVSHASLMTGMNPPSHGVRNNGEFALGPESVTLAEILGDQGWATAAFIGAAVLDSRYGLDQGFEEYDDDVGSGEVAGMFSYARRRGDEVVASALEWLAQRQSRRTFVWVHLYDPHAPYRPPEPERSNFPGRPYDGAIAFSDRVVGMLLDGYRRQEKFDRTLVVLTSDHGEGLGGHGEKTHGVFVYDETIRVPLVISGPGVPAGSAIETPVRLIDLMPTILSLVSSATVPEMEGRDLWPLISGRSERPAPPVYVESLLPRLNYGWSPLHGLRTREWKFIRGAGVELYDLAVDPTEVENVATREPQVVAELGRDLDSLLEDEGAATSRRLTVDESTRRQLAALGYFSLPTSEATGKDLPDPRIQIHTLEAINASLSRFAGGEQQAAIADLEAVVRREPVNLAAHYNLGQLKYRVADYVGAAGAFGRAADLAPGDAKYREFEGLALERAGKLTAALRAFEAALTVDPERRGSKALRWRVLSRLGRTEQLISELESALELDFADGVARVQLLRARFGTRPSPELIEALEEALAVVPEDPAVNSALAHALLGSGEEERAEALYRKVLGLLPGDHDSSLVVGRLALERGDSEDARSILEAGAAKHPERPAMQVELARARLAVGDVDGARRALAQAHRLDPESSHLWLVSGELHVATGDIDRAARDLDRAMAGGLSDERQRARLTAAYRALGLDGSPEAVAERRAAARR